QLAKIIEAQSAIVAGALTTDAVLALVCERALDLTPSTGSAVELADRDEMVYAAGAGALAGFVGLRLGLAGSLSGLPVRTGEILVCTDSETDSRVDLAACRRVGARSMVVVPLRYRDRPVGVLKVMAGTVAAFGPADVETLRLLANLIGASVAQAGEIESLI